MWDEGRGDLRLRRAMAADLDVILHHRREMFREMGAASDPVAATKADELSRAFFEKALREGHYYGWLFEDTEGRVVAGGGVILIEYHPSPSNARERRPWVVNMYTEPAARRQGLARRLMETMIEWARGEGYSNLFLHASVAGQSLYEGLGFMASNEMRLAL